MSVKGITNSYQVAKLEYISNLSCLYKCLKIPLDTRIKNYDFLETIHQSWDSYIETKLTIGLLKVLLNKVKKNVQKRFKSLEQN